MFVHGPGESVGAYFGEVRRESFSASIKSNYRYLTWTGNLCRLLNQTRTVEVCRDEALRDSPSRHLSVKKSCRKLIEGKHVSVTHTEDSPPDALRV